MGFGFNLFFRLFNCYCESLEVVLRGWDNNSNSKLNWKGVRLKVGILLSGYYSSLVSNDKMGRKNGEIMFIFKNYNKIR